MDDIWFVQQRSSKAWNIRVVESSVRDIKQDLLFIHAWSGCDSTCSIFGKGKVSIVKLFWKSKDLQRVSGVFMDATSTQKQVGDASIQAFQVLYGGSIRTTLRKLRFKKYMIISGRVNFHHENLPPTEQAANLHGLRVFYQIMEWRFLSDGMKNAEEWGWNKKDGLNMFPITTTAEYAPSYLQHVVRCQCTKPQRLQLIPLFALRRNTLAWNTFP